MKVQIQNIWVKNLNKVNNDKKELPVIKMLFFVLKLTKVIYMNKKLLIKKKVKNLLKIIMFYSLKLMLKIR